MPEALGLPDGMRICKVCSLPFLPRSDRHGHRLKINLCSPCALAQLRAEVTPLAG